jgi:glycosyltransferase involved in cell wall biosynthesis
MANDKKIKILFIVEAMGGGIFTYIVDLANELCKTYDMYIAYGIRNQTPKDYMSYFNPSIHMIYIESFTREINPGKDIKAFRDVRKVVAQVRPDIVHLHSSKAGVIGRMALNGEKVPLFYTPHGYSFLMQNYKPMKRKIFKTIETICAKRHCTTISCSPGEHEETLKLTKRAKYVNNGINVSDLEKLLKQVERKDHAFTVFTLGRITYQKNPVLFNQIAEKLPNVKFVWIGDGELRDQLNAPNIQITGWLDRKQALSISVNADIFLLTSLWEGLPMSLLEAMYMKKLCVVSDVIGNHDVIHNGKNGFVCRTVDEFVNAIESNETERLAEKAYLDVMNLYNTKVMADKYSEIYQECLKQSVKKDMD